MKNSLQETEGVSYCDGAIESGLIWIFLCIFSLSVTVHAIVHAIFS